MAGTTAVDRGGLNEKIALARNSPFTETLFREETADGGTLNPRDSSAGLHGGRGPVTVQRHRGQTDKQALTLYLQELYDNVLPS